MGVATRLVSARVVGAAPTLVSRAHCFADAAIGLGADVGLGDGDDWQDTID